MKLIGFIKTMLRKVWLRCIDSDTYIKYLRGKGIKVGDNVRFRYPHHTLIDLNRPTLIEFGNHIDINDNFTLLTHDFATYVIRGAYNDFVNCSGKVVIGNNVVFGRDVTVLRGVHIGDNTIVALGSVVTKSTPPNSVIAGCPARVICSLDEYYKKRKGKQIEEALEYANSLISHGRIPQIEDFKEEWCLYLTEDEYFNNQKVKQYVDFRMNGYVDIKSYLARERPFNGFRDFMRYVYDKNKTKKDII